MYWHTAPVRDCVVRLHHYSDPCGSSRTYGIYTNNISCCRLQLHGFTDSSGSCLNMQGFSSSERCKQIISYTSKGANYIIHQGETCRQLLQYGLFSQEQFFSWNPALNGNCDGLWLNYYYCVAAGDSLPAPPTETKRPTSIPRNQISTCTSWYQADGSETCEEIVGMFGRFSKDDLIKWNPSVGSDCGTINTDEYLCVSIPGTPTTRTVGAPSTTAPPSEGPTQSGMVAGCSELWLVSRLVILSRHATFIYTNPITVRIHALRLPRARALRRPNS